MTIEAMLGDRELGAAVGAAANKIDAMIRKGGIEHGEIEETIAAACLAAIKHGRHQERTRYASAILPKMQPGDTLVLTYPAGESMTAVSCAARAFAQALPDGACVVLKPDNWQAERVPAGPESQALLERVAAAHEAAGQE